ncbi:MAG: hypothetical protein DI632_03085 [Sphingomonas hengshuiensis]|uniref:C-type lysozyme inhibitor domain-containing protein n=1 Tax=Sphingomonas hengshuiensis TaxID=1609977 RepID=A0A2W4ZC16_9SPHN|nr:MAG: hypothetical protein DI632_03085 [Sphingomonas hengshuiensis]
MQAHAERWLLAGFALVLAGCGGDAPADNGAAPVVGGTPAVTVPVAASPANTVEPASSVPDRLTVTTNEPFYSVRVDPDQLVLDGIGFAPRRMPVLGREVRATGRRWRARDGRGELIVEVERADCEDDMSGAPRDFTATLTLDGRTVRGCGFVGTPAPPPGEAAPMVAANTIPARFVGRWNRDAAACARPAASIDGVKVSPDELWFHESVGKVQRVEPLSDDRIRITAAYDGEGERWTSTQTLSVDGDRLTIVTEGRPFTRIRCKG